jgi:hypothetical protein
MALTKRDKVWHTHFFVDGQRFRQQARLTVVKHRLNKKS